MDKIILYHFGFAGTLDENNPLVLFEEYLVPELLYLISSSKAYQYGIDELNVIFNTDVSLKLERMLKLGMIKQSNGKIAINFSVFLEDDVDSINKFTTVSAKIIVEDIMNLKEELVNQASKISCSQDFGVSRILYHVICDRILDGTALDYFSEEELFLTSKKQFDNRDYILIGYQDSDLLFNYNANILCSSNKSFSKKFIYNSFGDAVTDRIDMYRFSRKLESNNDDPVFNSLIEKYHNLDYEKFEDFIRDCSALLDGVIKKHPVHKPEIEDILIDLNYLKVYENEIHLNVPYFNEDDMDVISEISKLILNTVAPTVRASFESLTEYHELTPIKFGINKFEVANELWHQLFGVINEGLIKKGLVENPDTKSMRYLQALYKKKQ